MRRLVVALPTAALLLALSVAPALAQTGSVTITNLLCPTGYGGTDHAADCTEVIDPPLPFEISGPSSASGEPDVSGVVTFDGLAAGTYTVTGGVPGEFAEAVIECQGAETMSQDGVILTLEIAEEAEVTCSWWNIPEDLSGKTPTTAMPLEPASPLTAVGALLVLLAAVAVAVRGKAAPKLR